QHLINTLGPIELWAFSTSAEDVAIRSRLYARVGAAQARRLLGVNFPGGSARSEIRRRIASLSEKGEVEAASLGAVIETIVEELVGSTKVSLEELAGNDKQPATGQKELPPPAKSG